MNLPLKYFCATQYFHYIVDSDM